MIPVERGDGMEHRKLEDGPVRNHRGDKMSAACSGEEADEIVRCWGWRGNWEEADYGGDH